jgi:hypothetical protein
MDPEIAGDWRRPTNFEVSGGRRGPYALLHVAAGGARLGALMCAASALMMLAFVIALAIV